MGKYRSPLDQNPWVLCGMKPRRLEHGFGTDVNSTGREDIRQICTRDWLGVDVCDIKMLGICTALVVCRSFMLFFSVMFLRMLGERPRFLERPPTYHYDIMYIYIYRDKKCMQYIQCINIVYIYICVCVCTLNPYDVIHCHLFLGILMILSIVPTIYGQMWIMCIYSDTSPFLSSQ